jgi:hypothetical protein
MLKGSQYYHFKFFKKKPIVPSSFLSSCKSCINVENVKEKKMKSCLKNNIINGWVECLFLKNIKMNLKKRLEQIKKKSKQ